MYVDALDREIRAAAVWLRFIRRCRPKHSLIIIELARNGPCKLIDIANAVGREPKSVWNDLQKLGNQTPHGAAGDRLIEKLRPEGQKGLFFQLTARGRLAVEELAEAYEGPVEEEPDFYSFADEDDDGMMGDWMASRSYVRG